ncbi:MAG: hypothetical protein HY210_08675 [Candidatus Omnitrophica bacterium]|nr:hypothetical protein [Candidatus Omnitrophota bacterium]
MKKLTYLILAVTAVSLSASSVFAGQMKDGMMEDGMMNGGMMKMMHMMHGMTRSPVMAASNDGGVIVLTGNKLYKYDKNLNLVKEAEIKMEGDGGMMGGMGGMKKTCCQGKKMTGQGDTADEAAEGEAVQPAAEDAEHKSHH